MEGANSSESKKVSLVKKLADVSLVRKSGIFFFETTYLIEYSFSLTNILLVKIHPKAKVVKSDVERRLNISSGG